MILSGSSSSIPPSIKRLLMAARCLRDESMKVYRAIAAKDTEGARRAVSMIVGRDTAVLDDAKAVQMYVDDQVAKTFKNMSLADVKKAAEPFLTKEEKKDPKVSEEVPQIIRDVEEEEELVSDEQLVAVITAAIMAVLPFSMYPA